jgi:hypothetical protein
MPESPSLALITDNNADAEASTTTTVITNIETAAVATSSGLAILTLTVTEIDVDRRTGPATGHDGTMMFTETIFLTVTVDQAPEATAFTTVSQVVTAMPTNGPVKRKEDRVGMDNDLELKRYKYDDACLLTSSATSVPTRYAGICSDTVQYASACSCNGVIPKVMTLAATTIAKTQTTIITSVATNPVAAGKTVYIADTMAMNNSIKGSSDANTVNQTVTVTTTGMGTAVQTVVASETLFPDSGMFYCTISTGGYLDFNETQKNAYPLSINTDDAFLMHIDQHGNLLADGGSNYFFNVAGTYLSFPRMPLLISTCTGSGHDPIRLIYKDGYSSPVPDANRLLCALSDFSGRSGRLTCSRDGGGQQNSFADCDGSVYLSASVPDECEVATVHCSPWD